MTKTLSFASFLCAAVVGAVSTLAPAETLLVANQHDQSLSVIDVEAKKVVATIPVGGVTGHELAVSPDGKRAFVPIYGNAGVGRAGTDGTEISVIDLASKKIVGKVEFPHGVRPHCAVFGSNGMLYVTTELDKTVSIIDPKTLKVVGAVPTGQEQSHMFVLSHDGKRGYTANVGPGTVSVLDIPAKKTVTVIPISGNTQRISISRDGSMVFTADQKAPRMAVIDTATDKVKGWIPLESPGYGTVPTLDGRWLLVTQRDTGKLAVVDLKSMKVEKMIEVGKGPAEVILSKDGKKAYVACNFSNQIAVVDIPTWTMEGLIQAGNFSDGMAVAP
ncbi:MAG: beta-propeller fold lactonase family protein [Edaphobacter sp.]|uniref:beta-propeller fold lactonase family protein n=1 Tax=Edaphobacter sp. TaxID=1934404 RepID=UPI0023A57B8E|nr:beta-propeller fold lactonase family protein [Edaphobacter sp.]MDE1178023.1 beta-propeller fold lactonase family protein [Edaphobacter sp.]